MFKAFFSGFVGDATQVCTWPTPASWHINIVYSAETLFFFIETPLNEHILSLVPRGSTSIYDEYQVLILYCSITEQPVSYSLSLIHI